MARKRNTFTLGITLIVMFLLFVGVLLFIGSKGIVRGEMRPLVVRFPSMAGLGQKVGKVIDTRLIEDVDPTEPTVKDRLFLEIDATVDARLNLRSDCAVIASGPPLGGKGLLEITARGVSPDQLAPDAIVYGKSVGFQAVLAEITQELDVRNPQGLMTMIKGQLDATDDQSLMAKVHTSLSDINTMTATLASELDRSSDDHLLEKIHLGLDRVNSGLAEVLVLVRENRQHIDHALGAVDHALTVVDNDVVGAVASELDRRKEGSLMAQAHEAFDRLHTSLEDVNTITGATEKVVVLNTQRVDELVENATQASVILKNGVKDLVFHPWKLMAKPSAGQQRELQVFAVAREFAEAAADLDDASSRLKALLDANNGAIPADDPELQKIRSNLQACFERFSGAEQALWSEMNLR
jgi:hypothetical protein